MKEIKKMLYISPKLPSLSMVFEQNEILGIMENGIDITILSCRKVTIEDMQRTHNFAKKILNKVIYPKYTDAFKCIVESSFKLPKKSIGILAYYLIALLGNPLGLVKTTAAFLTAYACYSKIYKENYDWIHADFGKGSATIAFFLSTLLNCAFSFKVHAFDIYDRRLSQRDPLKLTKIKSAKVIFSAHEYGANILRRTHPKYEQKIKVNYVSIRPDDFSPLEVSCITKRFVAFGRLEEKKGFDILIKATEILKKKNTILYVDIYGDGCEYVKLTNMIVKKGLSDLVKLRGAYNNDDMPELIQDSLAVIVPSIIDKNGDMDGIPTVIFEAMSLGRPVIASLLSGIPEVVTDGKNGFLVESGNAQHLAQKMEYIFNDPLLVLEMAKEARRYVEEKHNYVMNAYKLIDIINLYFSTFGRD